MPILSAIRMTAYVIYQVKNAVSGCGLGTDIIILRRNQLLDRVNPDIIRKWEAAFRYYPSLERNIFNNFQLLYSCAANTKVSKNQTRHGIS